MAIESCSKIVVSELHSEISTSTRGWKGSQAYNCRNELYWLSISINDSLIMKAMAMSFFCCRCVNHLGSRSLRHMSDCYNAGEMAPPLTIVLVNNGGGGIFNFLPIADEMTKESFNQLWTTPQNVALAGDLPRHYVNHTFYVNRTFCVNAHLCFTCTVRNWTFGKP